MDSRRPDGNQQVAAKRQRSQRQVCRQIRISQGMEAEAEATSAWYSTVAGSVDECGGRCTWLHQAGGHSHMTVNKALPPDEHATHMPYANE